MKMLFKIFKRDLFKIKKNYAAIVIVIGLCIIPSLYAWINILACWDPYANTGNLPVAVVNKDEGAVINSKEINVGEQVIENLKENKSIKWEIIDEWQANNALNQGTYYAIIEIPQNFSNGLVSLTTSNPKKPNIIYKVNEKANAIATKITNVAKDKLTKEIKLNFVETVNEEAFNELNKLGLHLDNNRSKVLGIKDVVNTAESDLSSIQAFINTSAKNSEDLKKYIYSMKNDLPIITEQINDLQKATESIKDLVNENRNNLNTINNDINSNIIELQSLVREINNSLTSIKLSSGIKDEINKKLGKANNYINKMKDIVDISIKEINEINDVLNNAGLNNLVNELNYLNSLLSSEEKSIIELKQLANNGTVEELNKKIDAVIKSNDELMNNVVIISNNYYKNSNNIINNISKEYTKNLDILNSILETSKIIAPQLDALANYGIASSNESIKDSEELSRKISDIQESVSDLSSKLENLNGDSLNQIIELLTKDSSEIADFISSPINVKQVDVYGEGIFGVGLTPFYSVLAIWVGALLAGALLTTKCEDFNDGNEPNMMQRHFGKMLLFLSISLIQSFIIVLGDWLLLKVPVYNVPLLFGLAMLTSITFTIIIFTLVSILGNVGKAIAVIIMVFQIAGAGGIYPIQTNPEIFGMLYPLWPFTYSINSFREAISGPVWENVWISVRALLVYCIIFITLSILKKPLHKITHFMEHKFEESNL
ncbi:YhgE/Pip domain-containing protein [Clostridium tertium]|uniref:YhgE/Pip domain-containing protein n=1 Tax=Clostridium tertium TaxID=1559 RepID=UPI0024B3C370|nr:YhgE/Pip domain-containing protein [Clostridium tertium]MDI9218186.1 YhgE/Pip domain-containing protein [Clostridium tertium]